MIREERTPLTPREQMAMEIDAAVKVAHVAVHGLSQNILRAAAAELRKCCGWKPDDDGIFQTQCGHSFYFDGDGGPTEHGQKFCGYCGGTLIEIKPTVDATPASEAT